MAATAKEIKKYKAKGVASVEEGLPGWYGTFADMMTLLLAFFVLLAAISTIDPVKLQEMADSMGKKVGKQTKKGKAMNLADVKAAVSQMMKENKDLQKNVEISTSPKGVTIGISSDISFSSGSADLQPGIINVLEKILPTINDPNNKFRIAIEGHTDSDQLPEKFQDKYPSNWELSAARAAGVVRQLIEIGVDPIRLEAVGLAEFLPRDRPTDRVLTRNMIPRYNRDEIAKAKNRRVEITFKAK
ncbi:MAG: OmpA family protein [Candidatus Marinimicrobia bacterium]|nr:OmpA family protein [Candidatus Neomarinimicrobiota bacterium]